MAAIVSSLPIVSIFKYTPIKRENPAADNRVLVRSGNHFSINKTSLQASNNKIKVFEDGSKGIVCYRDESGEITCEGYDEGPRFCHHFSRFPYHPRDSEIIDLLQRCWIQGAEM